MQYIGRILSWLSWPVLGPYLSHSQRSRVLVSCNDSFLVVKSWIGNGKWGLPGGGLHDHESPVNGILRELEEETGLKLSPEQLTHQPLLSFNFRGRQFSYHFFTAQLDQPVKLRLQRFEIVDAQWLPRSELNEETAGSEVLSALSTWSA